MQNHSFSPAPIIESAKANGLEPYQYLKHVFEQLPEASNLNDYEQLLPWHAVLEKEKTVGN